MIDQADHIEVCLNLRVAHVKEGLQGLSPEVREIVIRRAKEAMDYKVLRNDIPF